jgi:hypothetical protein
MRSSAHAEVQVLRRSIGVLLAYSVLVAAPAKAAPCVCNDMADIQNRMTEAQTAIATYSTEMQKMAEQIMRTQQQIPYTPERRTKLQGRVQDALNKAMAGKLPTAPGIAGESPGGTSNLCTMTINLGPSATACMRASVTRHEEHHQQECMKTLSPGKVVGSIGSGKDRFERDGKSLVQYAMEEIGGYTAELQFLQGELTRLKQSEECKPKQPKPEQRDYTAQPRGHTAKP